MFSICDRRVLSKRDLLWHIRFLISYYKSSRSILRVPVSTRSLLAFLAGSELTPGSFEAARARKLDIWLYRARI
jgi:hypothetical protein